MRKRYGGTVALDGLDLEVTAGTACGLLGPDGAGKTPAAALGLAVMLACGLAVAWPLLLVAVFLPLAVRRYQGLGR